MKTPLQGNILYKYLVILFFACSPGCSSTKSAAVVADSLPATKLKPFGRTVINNQNLELVSSASHVGFSFEGGECRLMASVPQWLDHNYLQYELDGVYQKRVRISSKTGEPVVITAAGSGKHTVWIYKATEAHTGPVSIQRITGRKLNVLQRPSAPLVEFIGNSITCGAAADPSEVPCGTGEYHDQHNAYMAYGPRVGRSLGANYILSSVSGIGIYRTWNTDGPNMPQVYEKVDFQQSNPQQWDFSTYSPKVVSIALGTNDLSRGDGKHERKPFDSAVFVNTYVQFVQLVKSKYPAAQIALLSSPMMHGRDRELLQNCLTAVKEKVDASRPATKPMMLPVEVFFFSPMQARGCTGHPNVDDHKLMADELLPFFKRLLQQPLAR
jgi:lysophospholipase L1-like esterase